VLARYVAGMAEAGRSQEADATLRALHDDRDQGVAVTLACVELGATTERLRWIETSLREGLFSGPLVLELGRRRDWLASVDDEEVATFVGVLLAVLESNHSAAALEILVDRSKTAPSSLRILAPLLLVALERLAPERVHGMTDYYWELGADALAGHAPTYTASLAELSIVAIARVRGSSDHAWKVLHHIAEIDPEAAWRAVAAALAARDANAAHLLIAFRFHRRSFSWPEDAVLRWVGDDERRAREVVALVRPYVEVLPPVLRALIQRFGPQSRRHLVTNRRARYSEGPCAAA
jgi:hypothetical protein